VVVDHRLAEVEHRYVVPGENGPDFRSQARFVRARDIDELYT
jgi:hypothetical protein